MDIFFSVGIVQALFSIILISKKRELILADKVLMLLIAFWGSELIYSLLNFVYIQELPDFVIFPFTFGPLLYFYTYLLSSEKSVLPHRYWRHFIPFVVFLLIAIFLRPYLDYYEASFTQAQNTGLMYIVNFSAFIIQSLYYWVKINKAIKHHRNNLLHKLSIDSEDINLNWIRLLSIFVFGGFALFALVDTVFFLWSQIIFDPSIFLHIGILIALYSVSFFGFKQEAIFESQQYKRFVSPNEQTAASQDQQQKDELAYLLTYLDTNKPYLIRNLTLQNLANALNMPSYKLSELINSRLQKNFFTLINEMRVEEAKQRIVSNQYSHLTLSAIGFDSGFNSKSTFHDLFKKYTGITPAQYKKKKGQS